MMVVRKRLVNRIVIKQARSEESESDEEAHDGREKTSGESDSDEEVVESRRRKRKPAASKKSVKRTQAKLKAHSLSLDDVFGAYSTDDESTQQSRGSLAPSVDSKNDKREKTKEKKEKEREAEKGKEKETTEKEKEEGEKEKERTEKQREKERDKAKEKEKEEKDKEGEMERSEEVEKEKEKKVESKKRSKKTLSTVELFGRDSDVDMPPEKKKQKVEKSLVEISMFPEMNKKEPKQKKKESSRKTSEVKKAKEAEKAQVSKTEQFEKKLAKRLRKEQKEREEEQKREADESKKKKEENRIERDIEKSSGQTGKEKEIVKTEKENREEEEDNIQKMEVTAETQHDEKESMKTETQSEEMPQNEVVEEAAVKEEYECSCESIDEKQLEEGIKQDDEHKTNENIVDLGEKPPLEDEVNGRERKRKADENEGVFDVKRVKEETKEEMPRKQLSDSDSSAGETKQKNTRRQKTTKRRAARKRVKNEEMETISEPRSDSSTTAAVKSELSEESERLLTPSDTVVKPCVVDEPASEKYSLLEDASKWGAESAKSVTDDDESASVSARTLSKDAMKAPPDENIAASQSPHVTTKDGNQSSASDDEQETTGPARQRSVSSSSSSTSRSSSCRSSSSATAEPDAEAQVDALAESCNAASESTRSPVQVEVKVSESEVGPQPELDLEATQEPRLPPSESECSPEKQAPLPLRPNDMIAFVASSDAVCSAVSMVTSGLDETEANEFDTENGDSNGGFELIDSGRVEDMITDDGVGVPPERDVHDVQETEDAVQSIALFDDNASRHSGEEGSAAMDINYMSDATSRRSSIADTATVLAQDSQDVQKEFTNGTTEDQEEKDVDADAEVQQEMETKVDEESNNDDEKLVDSVTHIDEVIDDVVAGGYMEVDAEQLMLINSKAKEEADRAAALASQQNTPQTPHSTHSFQADSSQTAASARSVEHQHQMNVPSNSICMMQSQMMQQQSQTQQIQQQQQQPQMQQQPHSQQSQPTIASPYHQMQQPLSMQHTQSRHEIIHQQTVPVNAPAEMHQAIGVRVQQQTMQQQQQPVQQSSLQQQHQPLQQQQQQSMQQQQQQSMQQQQQSMQQPQQQPSVQQIHQKVVQSQQPLQQPPTQQQMMQQHSSLQSPTMQHLMQRQTIHQQQQAHQMAVHVQPQQQQMHQLQQQKLFTEQPPIEQPVQASASVALHQQQQQQTEVQRTNPVGYACASDYFTSATGAQQSESMQSPHASRGMQSSMGTQQHQLGYGNLPAATAAPSAHMQMQAAVSTCQRLNQPTSAYDIYRQPPSVKQQQPPVAHQHQSQQQQQPTDVSRQSVSHISGTSTSPSMLTHLPGTSSSIPQLNASVSLQQQQANSAAYRRQQPSPMQQAAIAASAALSPFAMALPATSSSTYFQTAQMQEQYMQMCRNTLLQQGGAASTAQPPQDTAAQVMRNYAHIFQAATNAYGSGMSGTYGAPPHAAYPTSASLVNGGTSSNASPLTTGMQQERARQQQTQQAGLNHGTQAQSCAVSVQQQNQQANIAAVAQQQLNSLYSNGSLTFGYGTPTVQQHTARQSQQVTQQNIPLGAVPQRQQQVKVANTASKKQQIKTFPQPPSVASSSRYPVLWQGIVALKTNEARIQMHRVGGNIEMLKRSLVQLATMSNNMPVIRINQRMRMEASQLESVQSKMTDEQSYIALICLSCGFNKDDIRNQSEMLKERFVDYLESKQAAGICNVGNEQHPSPNSIVHVFPPCEFATTFLQRNSPDLFETIRQQRANYLFVVITSAS
uniref:Msx2-interacting protein n=1 Tax=Ascaris suum TaxID=6253 RepID=F1KPJ2_ASCSU